MLTGTKEWPCSGTRRCHWRPHTDIKTLQLRRWRYMMSWKHTHTVLFFTCHECRECSSCRCVCLCALSRCHWTSYGVPSSWRRSGRCWPLGLLSLRHAAGWKTNAPRTPGRLRGTKPHGRLHWHYAPIHLLTASLMLLCSQSSPRFWVRVKLTFDPFLLSYIIYLFTVIDWKTSWSFFLLNFLSFGCSLLCRTISPVKRRRLPEELFLQDHRVPIPGTVEANSQPANLNV